MSSISRSIASTLVGAIGFGAMGLSVAYGAVESDEKRLEFLDALYASGCRLWDSAAVYGDNEELLGKWFKKTGKRNDIFLVTKLGFLPETRGDAEWVRQNVDESLKKLDVDSIDLYYIHRIDQKLPIEVTMRALKEEVKAGKIKNIGLSECSAATLRRAHAIHPIAAVQIEYSPFVLDIEKNGLLAACRELGVTVVAYSPLGRGLLTGRYQSPDDFEADDFRRFVPKYSAENFPKILKVVNALREIAAYYDATPGQVVLAWLLAQGSDIMPIPGTKSVKYLKENLDAANLTLKQEDVSRIRAIAEEADKIGGGRYPDMWMDGLFADTPAEN